MQNNGRSIEVDRIVLTDANGRSCAILGTSADGSVALTFLDKEGNPRAVLGLAEDGSPELTFADARGGPRVGLSIAADQSPSLAFIDGRGSIRLGMSVSPEGAPEMIMADGEERTRASLGIGKNGLSFIQLVDADQTRRQAVFAQGAMVPRFAPGESVPTASKPAEGSAWGRLAAQLERATQEPNSESKPPAPKKGRRRQRRHGRGKKSRRRKSRALGLSAMIAGFLLLGQLAPSGPSTESNDPPAHTQPAPPQPKVAEPLRPPKPRARNRDQHETVELQAAELDPLPTDTQVENDLKHQTRDRDLNK